MSDIELGIEDYVLKPEDFPARLYRVHNIHYYQSLCASVEKIRGLFALKASPGKLKTVEEFYEEVHNHLSIAKPSMKGPIQSQWPSPFLSVFSKRADAERFLKTQGEKKGDTQWIIYVASGARLRKNCARIFKLPPGVQEEGVFKSQLLVWRTIPEKTLLYSLEWGTYRGRPKRQRYENPRLTFKKTIQPLDQTEPRGELNEVGQGQQPEPKVAEAELPGAQIKSVTDHDPFWCGYTTAKAYFVILEGCVEGEWRDAEDVPENHVDQYWEDKTEREKEEKAKTKKAQGRTKTAKMKTKKRKRGGAAQYVDEQ